MRLVGIAFVRLRAHAVRITTPSFRRSTRGARLKPGVDDRPNLLGDLFLAAAGVDHDAAPRLAFGQRKIRLAQLLVKLDILRLEAVGRRIACSLFAAA